MRAKPTFGLLLNLAPDYAQACLVAEAFGLEQPSHELRDEADRDMAEIISKCDLPEPGVERKSVLARFLKPLVDAAISACQKWKSAEAASDAATGKLIYAQTHAGYWLLPLEERSDFLAEESARALISAYGAYSNALGASRAIELAGAGIEWTAFDAKEEMIALCSKKRFSGITGK